MALAWTSDMNTGIDVIDNQHKRIVECINDLEQSIQHNDRAAVARVLDELVDYTLSHFAFEESLQTEAGYQFAKPHKAIHDTFAKRIAKYQERHRAGEDVTQPLFDMLRTWLVHHIKRDDMAYVAKVNASMASLSDDKQQGSWISRALGRFFR